MNVSRLLWTLLFGCWLVTKAAEETLTYVYDSSLRLTAISMSGGKRIEYVYDSAGNVLGRTIRAFVDSDNDGLDDNWEQTHFGSLSRDGTGDFDGDTASDRSEFLAETNPKDAVSVLKVIRLSSPALVEWNSQPGVRYRVQYTDSLMTPSWHPLGGDVVATGAASQLGDSAGLANRERYYRVLIVP